MKFVYARVSSRNQSLDRQIDNLTKQGCEEIYEGDTISVPPYNGVFKVNIYDYDMEDILLEDMYYNKKTKILKLNVFV